MDDLELPPFVLTEREGLLVEILEAFPGGSRKGGVSWSEASVIDNYGSPEQREVARMVDRDTRWQDLLENPTWNPDEDGHWSFLDATGFRYYLPAAMVLAVRRGYDAGILFHLTLPEGDLRDYSQSQWTLLDLPQRLCVKRFLQYMAIVDAYGEALHRDREYVDGWFGALRSYWGRISDGETGSGDPLRGSGRRGRKRGR